MDWLRSEDLKEEKNVTAPIAIIAVQALCRSHAVARRTVGHAANESRTHRSMTNCSRFILHPLIVPVIMSNDSVSSTTFDHSVAADILVREEPDQVTKKRKTKTTAKIKMMRTRKTTATRSERARGQVRQPFWAKRRTSLHCATLPMRLSTWTRSALPIFRPQLATTA